MLDLKITDGEVGVREPVTKPHPGFFYEVGEERFRKLVNDHYESIRDSKIASLFPVNDVYSFEDAKKHAADFFIEFCGGPDYFTQTRGEYQMVGRHSPFRITDEDRKEWLRLYQPLLQELLDEGISEEYIQSFWDYIEGHSKWMINTKE